MSTTTMPRYAAMAELIDGTVIGPVRITLKTKFAVDRARRQQGWDAERDGVHVDAWMAWHALHDAGLLPCDWEAVTANVVDLVTMELDDGAPASSEDPTQPGH